MSETIDEPQDSREREADLTSVRREQDSMRGFVAGLSPDEIKSGAWFAKLLAQALDSYTDKIDWSYFQERYRGVPADAIVDQRIKMASRYAALEGGLSAGAYTGAVVATIGTAGGASPVLVPAAVATMMVDVAFTTQLQLRLAYDISVLYRVPLDLADPDDMWKLLRVAFTIRSGEVVREGAAKIVPALMRPLIKRFYSGAVLTAARGIPFVGKFLLQRTVIKIGIPLVGVPLAVVLNRYATLITGRHARLVFRNEARIVELAGRLSTRSRNPQLLLWVAWLVIMSDGSASDDEALLMRHLVQTVREEHGIVDSELADIIEFDHSELWRRLEAEDGDLRDLIEAGEAVATVDGPINAKERAAVAELRKRSYRA